MLLNHSDTAPDGFARGVREEASRLDEDVTGVGRRDPSCNLEERALPCPVLADDRVNLAGREGEADAADGDDPFVALRYVDEAERLHWSGR
jgi:hypothetical protein